MACISQSAATLRIGGDALVPEEITGLLGASPTSAQTKGEETVGRRTGRVRVAKCGMWRLEAPDSEPADLDGQIRFIFEQLTDDLTVWNSLASRFKIDLFCGLFMDQGNEGIELSPDSLRALGARSVKVCLDVYGPLSGDQKSTSEQAVDARP